MVRPCWRWLTDGLEQVAVQQGASPCWAVILFLAYSFWAGQPSYSCRLSGLQCCLFWSETCQPSYAYSYFWLERWLTSFCTTNNKRRMLLGYTHGRSSDCQNVSRIFVELLPKIPYILRMKIKFKSYRFLRLKKYNQRIMWHLKMKASKNNATIDTNHKWT